jgi:hypothetical protein
MGSTVAIGYVAVGGILLSIAIPLLKNAICVFYQESNDQQNALNAMYGRPQGSGCTELPDYCKKCDKGQ